MKKTILLMLMGISVVTGNAQLLKETDVPSIIKKAFTKMYHGIKTAQWNKENDEYEASFSNGKYQGSVMFDANGKWTERETAISVNELPTKAKSYLKKHYKKSKLLGAARITKASGEIQCKAEIKGKHIFFTKEGDFIKEG